MRRKRAFLLLLGLVGVVGLVWFVLRDEQNDRAKIGIRQQDVTATSTPIEDSVEYVPPFRTVTVQGKEFAIADLEDKSPVVIEFVASWCDDCLTGIANVRKIADEYGYGAVAIVAVHRTDTETGEKAVALASQFGSGVVLLMDTEGKLFRLLNEGAPHMPLALFIDRSGRVVARVRGPTTEEMIRVNLAKIVTP